MYKDGKIEKTLKPSQRQSITEFSSKFGTGPTYDEKMRTKRAIYTVIIIIGAVLLLAAGYFLTDVLIKITELPYNPKVNIQSEVVSKWITFPIIQG